MWHPSGFCIRCCPNLGPAFLKGRVLCIWSCVCKGAAHG
ncbi:type II secretion system protein GspE [Acetobacter orientalis]|uniref:Type II secretion system protein GspE n=1 Tax=Acetobacter orientalis TaxID=146474 RepID=A0A2Z5ZGS9_9PROT|nr:type II secretion system protein GspE [Acetobacter orientalis]